MTEWGIDTLFNPGKRHMDEEKRRLQSTREEVGDSSGGRRIDLESGTVTISRRPKQAPAAATEAAVDDANSAEDDVTEDSAEDGPAEDSAGEDSAGEAGTRADGTHVAEPSRSTSQE